MENIMKSNNKYNKVPEPKKILRVESESWALDSGIQLKESWIPLTIGIRNPISTEKESLIQDLESLHPGRGIRIQDCHILPYMERFLNRDNSSK